MGSKYHGDWIGFLKIKYFWREFALKISKCKVGKLTLQTLTCEFGNWNEQKTRSGDDIESKCCSTMYLSTYVQYVIEFRQQLKYELVVCISILGLGEVRNK